MGNKESFSLSMKALHKMLKEESNPAPTCPCCGGRGSYLEEGDAHRSSGYVPCYYNGKAGRCYKGKWTPNE